MNSNTASTPRRILDAIHRSPLAQWIPLGIALCAYVLYLLAGAPEQKLVLAIGTPIVCLIVYFLFSKVILPVLKTLGSADNAVWDVILLILTGVFALAALSLLMQFLTDLQYGFTAGLPLSLVVWSAVSRACRSCTAE